MRTILSGMLAVTIWLLTTFTALGQAPRIPHAFFGQVLFGSEPAPVGAVVEARGEGVRMGIPGNPLAVAQSGQYGGAGGFDPKLLVQGTIADGLPVTFFVNGTQAQCAGEDGVWRDSYPFRSGAITVLNLRLATAPSAAPTEASVEPTATPSAMPSATQQAQPTAQPTQASASRQESNAPTVGAPTPTTMPSAAPSPSAVASPSPASGAQPTLEATKPNTPEAKPEAPTQATTATAAAPPTGTVQALAAPTAASPTSEPAPALAQVASSAGNEVGRPTPAPETQAQLAAPQAEASQDATVVAMLSAEQPSTQRETPRSVWPGTYLLIGIALLTGLALYYLVHKSLRRGGTR